MIAFRNDRSGPFTHAPTSVQGTMRAVMLALVPATLLDAWLFGWPAISLFLVTVGACLAVEAACHKAQGKPVRAALTDGSAALTGWLPAPTSVTALTRVCAPPSPAT